MASGSPENKRFRHTSRVVSFDGPKIRYVLFDSSLFGFMATGGVSPQSIVVDPTGRFVYVANEGCPGDFSTSVGNVSIYAIDATTGTLTAIGLPVPADFGARSVTVDPSGKFTYVANNGDGHIGSVSMYTINATTGVLNSIGSIPPQCAPPPSPGSCAPFSVAVHPSGKFAYVANEGGYAPTSVSMYSVDAKSGALMLIGTIAAGGRAHSVTVDRTGKFAYVTDVSNGFAGESNNVSMYVINGATGALTANGTIAADVQPTSIVIEPSGKFAYVTTSSSNEVSMYSINTTTGALTSMGPIAAGINPSAVVVDPAGKFAYVTNSTSNDVSMYSIDTTTGALTPIGTIGT
jgi:DNA-binding beta-propeller fold protein YncE